jgi:hypothetical protein
VVRSAEKGSHFLTLWLNVGGVGCMCERGCGKREKEGGGGGRGSESEREREHARARPSSGGRASEREREESHYTWQQAWQTSADRCTSDFCPRVLYPTHMCACMCERIAE